MNNRYTFAFAAAALSLCCGIGPAAHTGGLDVFDVVRSMSGASGTDDNLSDFDLLRDALVITELADTIAAANSITMFAPNDRAFLRLARDLGYFGDTEAAAFEFVLDELDFVSADEPGLLDDIVLYHVVPDALTLSQLRDGGDLATLLDDATVAVTDNQVIDADGNDRNARFRAPRNLMASNGIIQSVNRVLRPIDLEGPAPADVVQILSNISGDNGNDSDFSDFDLLRDALVLTELSDVIASLDNITLIAPTDRGFFRLARDLGFEGSDEADAFDFLIDATGFVSPDEPGQLESLLLYHVTAFALTLNELRDVPFVPTLLGLPISVEGDRVRDADFDATDARFRQPTNIEGTNGFLHAVNRVARPLDL